MFNDVYSDINTNRDYHSTVQYTCMYEKLTERESLETVPLF